MILHLMLTEGRQYQKLEFQSLGPEINNMTLPMLHPHGHLQRHQDF